MFKKKQQPMDERIEKESNKLSAKMYYAVLVSAIVMLGVKLFYGLPLYLYALEIVALLTMILYVVVKESGSGVLFMNKRDDATKTFHESVLAKAFNLAFYEMILGELILLFVLLIWAREYFFWVCSYFVIWVPAALVYTVLVIKNGLFIWGSKKKEQEGKKSFGKATFKGSLFFGCFMGVFFMITRGGFSVKYLVMMPIMAAMWGIPYYLIMTFMMKQAEKQADKRVEAVENGSEE